jgi:hypothetical protein
MKRLFNLLHCNAKFNSQATIQQSTSLGLLSKSLLFLLSLVICYTPVIVPFILLFFLATCYLSFSSLLYLSHTLTYSRFLSPYLCFCAHKTSVAQEQKCKGPQTCGRSLFLISFFFSFFFFFVCSYLF